MKTDHTSDNEAFRETLIEEARGRAGDHPGVDSLVDYLGGSLDADSEERIRDHLVACPECASATLDLDSLMQPDEANREDVADLEIESAWRALAARIEPDTRSREVAAARSAGLPRWAVAVAASLLVATVGLSVWVSQLLEARAELSDRVAALSQPQVNPPIVYLDAVTRSEPSGIETEIAPNQPFVLLIAIPSAPELFSSYEAAITDASDAVIWSGDGLVLNEEGTLRLWLPRTLLPEGDYQVRIRGLGADSSAAEDAEIVTLLRVVHR